MNRHQADYRRIDPLVQEALERIGRTQAIERDRDEEEPAFDLRSLLGLIRRQRWTIAAAIVLGLGLATLYLTQVERQYSASAVLVVDTSESEALQMAPGLNDTLGANSIVGTEIEIMRSQAVNLLAAQYLNLPNSSVFDPRPSRWNSLLNIFGLGSEPPEVQNEPVDWVRLSEADQNGWAAKLAKHISVTQRGATTAIEVTATTNSPEESARWANAIAEAYLDEQVISKQETRDRVIDTLQERVTIALADLRAAEAAFDQFLFDAIEQAGSQEVQAALREFESLNAELETQRAGLGVLEDAFAADDFQTLAREVDPALADERADLQEQLTEETDLDRMADIREQIDLLEEDIANFASARVSSLETQVANLQQLASDSQSDLVASAVDELPSTMIDELVRLRAAVDRARSSYNSRETALQDAQQQLGVGAVADARVIAWAVPPDSPSYPSIRSTVIMAFLLSAAAGFGMALLRENLTGGISTVEQMEQDLRIPVVTAVPKVRAKRGEPPDWLIVEKPLSAYAEAIRRARIGLEASVGEQQLRLVVTSAVPGDGKTTMALSIARALEKSGRSTILIDADLRHPNVREHTDQQAEAGLLDYLLRGRDGSHLIVSREPSTGLTLIVGSEPSPVATDSLLMSDRFRKVADYAADNFDCVVFDSPPVGLVVDARVIAKDYANAALFVAKADAASKRVVESALRELQVHSEVPVLGVLNQVSGGRKYYGKYEGYYR